MRLIRLSIIPLAMVGLSACTTIGDKYGFLKDETQSYRKVNPVETPVVIPQNLRSNQVQDYYEVPQPAAGANPDQPLLVPPGANIAPPKAPTISQQDRIRSAESAKIQGHTSAAANGPVPIPLNFSQAWTKVGSILKASNYKIMEKDNVLGTYYVIDTNKTGGKVKKDMPIYQIHLRASGSATVVTVTPANPSLQQQINSNLIG